MVCIPHGEVASNKGRTRFTMGITRLYGIDLFASDERCPHTFVQRRRRRPEIVVANIKLLLDLSSGVNERFHVLFQPFLWVWG